MFRVNPRATLGLIFFTVFIQKSDKQCKVLSGCLKNLPTGIPSGHQTFPWGCASQECLMTLRNSLGQSFPDNHYGLSTVYTRYLRELPISGMAWDEEWIRVVAITIDVKLLLNRRQWQAETDPVRTALGLPHMIHRDCRWLSHDATIN